LWRLLGEQWFAQVQAAVDAGDYSPGTSLAYRDRLDKQVVPALGALLVGEVTVARVDRLLRARGRAPVGGGVHLAQRAAA
jgi:hypothetical protein